MKTTIGGDRIGSGNKQEISLKNYERSTHDLSELWRSSMSAGTLVPFLKKIALPGDSFDIDLNCQVITLPTIGPLFGSYKIQLDVFEAPIRLYNAGLHMNKLGIGMDMSRVLLPQLRIRTNNHTEYIQTYEDNEQINSSSIFKYLGISGLGNITGGTNPATRDFNAIPFLGYWDIYKNYYANKQEEVGYVIHTGQDTISESQAIEQAILRDVFTEIGDILNNPLNEEAGTNTNLTIIFGNNVQEPNSEQIQVELDGTTYLLTEIFNSIEWDGSRTLFCSQYSGIINGEISWEILDQDVPPIGGIGSQISISRFDLENIDEMRESILQHPFESGTFIIDETSISPYGLGMEGIGAEANTRYSCQFTQEGLGLKTYQSDLFNNWITTEWIDGTNGINEVTSVSTTGDSFTIDALNLASKVYIMLNRIAISGGTYDDWLDAVYRHERAKSVETPIYHGSLIKELAFEEVISNSETGEQPLGTLAGRGRLTQKHKGGKIKIKINEPSYIMGIVSITPRIEYSQGNEWDMNLRTMNDLHKPDLDAIGFQDLITDQMVWSDTELNSETGDTTFRSAGKQPAWINYMTSINKCFGNFAEEDKEMFMVLNRRYEKNINGEIGDLTTYVDPTKFNHIFAETNLNAQNFWVQISSEITARRKMSAKVIPNL